MGFVTSLVKGLGIVVLVLIAAIVLTVTAARFADGPWAVISGGKFTSGEPAAGEPDWNFVKDYDTVEFQLLEPESSRTTWIMVSNNRVFIPSGYMNTDFGKLWKQWPAQAEKDGRAILRVDNTLYNRQLVRVGADDPDIPGVLSEVSRKYFQGNPVPVEEVASNNLWVFELLPR